MADVSHLERQTSAMGMCYILFESYLNGLAILNGNEDAI